MNKLVLGQADRLCLLESGCGPFVFLHNGNIGVAMLGGMDNDITGGA